MARMLVACALLVAQCSALLLPTRPAAAVVGRPMLRSRAALTLQEAPVEEPPLPEGWATAKDSEGATYYWNKARRTSSVENLDHTPAPPLTTSHAPCCPAGDLRDDVDAPGIGAGDGRGGQPVRRCRPGADEARRLRLDAPEDDQRVARPRGGPEPEEPLPARLLWRRRLRPAGRYCRQHLMGLPRGRYHYRASTPSRRRGSLRLRTMRSVPVGRLHGVGTCLEHGAWFCPTRGHVRFLVFTPHHRAHATPEDERAICAR